MLVQIRNQVQGPRKVLRIVEVQGLRAHVLADSWTGSGFRTLGGDDGN